MRKIELLKLGNPRIIYNSSCELLHDLIQPVGEDKEDKEDEFENESFFGRDGMDFLWKKPVVPLKVVSVVAL